jgi:hypothetical protein
MVRPQGPWAPFLSAPAYLYRRIILPWPALTRVLVFVLYWSTRRAGRSSLPSRYPPARIGTRALMAAGCGGHRMAPVEACWTQATSMAGWWCTRLRRGPKPSSSHCRRTSPRNGSKASRRTPSLSTSPVVRCALIPGSANTRWSLLTHIWPAEASRQGSFPAVCGPLPCPCRRNLDAPRQQGEGSLATKRLSVGSYE